MKLGNPLAQIVPNDKAVGEMKRFLLMGWILTGVGLFVFPFLAYGGVAFGGRSVVLTFHAGTRRTPKLNLYRIANFCLVILSFYEIWYMLNRI